MKTELLRILCYRICYILLQETLIEYHVPNTGYKYNMITAPPGRFLLQMKKLRQIRKGEVTRPRACSHIDRAKGFASHFVLTDHSINSRSLFSQLPVQFPINGIANILALRKVKEKPFVGRTFISCGCVPDTMHVIHPGGEYFLLMPTGCVCLFPLMILPSEKINPIT